MANSEYGSGLNLDAMVVPVKAATVFAAQENSLYLPGTIVPKIEVPAGSASAQVPLMGSVTATTITSEGAGGSGNPQDFETVLPSDTKKTINLSLHAARTVLRDLGGIDTADMGRIMGNAIATAVDKEITSKMVGLTEQEITSGNLDTDEIFSAVGTIRGAGENGKLFGIVSTDAYANLLSSIGSNSFAGGEFQNSAMRNGFFGNIAGVECYVSSYLNNTTLGSAVNPKMAIFSADAMRMAAQGGVNVEVARRPEAVGFDVVASMAQGAILVDATRGVLIIDQA
tara:strand:- start:69 stop:920 length:852 start_codon:yes stop_codon:yes gene_type:complete